VEQPIYSAGQGHWSSEWPSSSKRDGNPEGQLFGETLVFTGSLAIPRREAADAAAAAGCRVDESVTKHTTMLVVGDQDVRTLIAGHVKSTKYMKAEQLIGKGQLIRILGESDFMRIVSNSDSLKGT
jgi:DNA polymerase-3 subunit epsilon